MAEADHTPAEPKREEEEMSDEELKYATEADRANAIESFDETKGTADELQRIMNAKIEPKADDTPPQATDASTQKTVEEKAPAAPAPVPVPAPAPATNPDEWAKSKGYASFAEARKAFDEKEDLIQKQTKFIKEKIEPQAKPNDQLAALLLRNRELEELASSKSRAPAGEPKSEVEHSENKIAVLKESLNANLQKRRALVEELKADPGIAIDGDFLARRLAVEAEKDDLDVLMYEELNVMRSSLDGTNKQIKDYTAQQSMAQQREQNERLYNQEMSEITEFASNPKHPEFLFTPGKDSEAVEAEYVNWANKVASAVYAGPVNMLNQTEKPAVAQALALIRANDPDALMACRAAGIEVEPNADIKKYIEICDLLNHRDGQRLNPINGQMEQQYRLVRDSATGQFRKDPVRFASLEDAYQHKLAVDGTYMERIKDSYVKGSRDMAAAAQKRAAAPVELDNASGASNADVGLGLSPQDAMKELEAIDEAEAMRRKLSGDSTMYDRFQKLLGALDTVKV